MSHECDRTDTPQITEDKRIEETFAELIERSPFGIYVVDSQFRIAMMTPGSQEGIRLIDLQL